MSYVSTKYLICASIPDLRVDTKNYLTKTLLQK